ncbi:MAG: zinc-dependent metalloprotease, partial [Bacteroidota bacterium]
KNINGKVIFRKEKEAFDIYTNDMGEVFISPIDINKVICVDYNKYKDEEGKNDDSNKENNETSKHNDETMMVPLLNSLPGGYGTLYLDFDGENVSGGSWGTINAAPSSFTNANITTIWTAVSEDYSPFNVNVTTDRTVFNSAIATRRMMVIFTPTDDAAPGAGGVAFINSWGSGNPCWDFNLSVKSAEETASHEAGHTFGLKHDGTSTKAYYAGHGKWGPIMGAVFTRPIVHWCKGEYTGANNQEDDLVKISSKVPYRVDDHGSTIATATILNADASGNVLATNNFGVIERRTDLDIFKFNASAGNVSLTIKAKTESGSASVPNLDIQARLLDASGTEIIKVDPSNVVLSTVVSIVQNISAGTYYLEIDGVAGYGSPLNSGYSDYGSLGQFFISGSFPPGTATGITDNNHLNEISVFPNPSSGQFTLSSEMNSSGTYSVELFNSLGQSVMTSSETASGNFRKDIFLPGIASGIYCLVIKTEDSIWQKKVLIK